MKKTNHIIAIVGMPGSGKTILAEYLSAQYNYTFIRFGQIVLDKIKEMGKTPSEELERTIRNELRTTYGQAAMAIANMPFLEEKIKESSIVIDGLYSWAEYKVLKEKFADALDVVAVYASPKTRYARLSERKLETDDTDMKKRPLTPEQAKNRDYHEIEEIEKSGPIAMADVTIINEHDVDELYRQADDIITKVL